MFITILRAIMNLGGNGMRRTSATEYARSLPAMRAAHAATMAETHCYACGEDAHDGECADDVDLDAGEYRGPGCSPSCGC